MNLLKELKTGKRRVNKKAMILLIGIIVSIGLEITSIGMTIYTIVTPEMAYYSVLDFFFLLLIGNLIDKFSKYMK